MNETIYALVESFKTITKWEVSKNAAFIGFSLMAFFVVLGYFIWGNLVSLTSYLLEMIPFTFIKSNGAWMLSSLVFIQLIFITFSFVIIIFSTKIVQDSKHKDYPKFILTIALSVVFFWIIVWYFNHEAIYNALSKLLLWLPFETIEKTLSYIFALYLLYSLYVVSLLIFVSLDSKKIIKLGIGEEIKTFFGKSIFIYTVKDSIIFIILSIVLFPFLFIPVLNFFIQLAVWTWFGKDTYTLDAGSIFYNKSDIQEIKAKHKKAIWFISLVAACFNFIPILNIYSPYFGEFAMYYLFEAYEENIG
ncbi:MAG: hypothetical protein GXO12_05550 [Epsilonproteobacteria bacterium]|nr:hypothetical protein [Campylobacterota bacterium]